MSISLTGLNRYDIAGGIEGVADASEVLQFAREYFSLPGEADGFTEEFNPFSGLIGQSWTDIESLFDPATSLGGGVPGFGTPDLFMPSSSLEQNNDVNKVAVDIDFADDERTGTSYASSVIPGLIIFAGSKNEEQKAQALIAEIEQMYFADPDFAEAMWSVISTHGTVEFTIGQLGKADNGGTILGQAGVGTNQIMIDTDYFDNEGGAILEGMGDRLRETIAHELLHLLGHTHKGENDEVAHDAAIQLLLNGENDYNSGWMHDDDMHRHSHGQSTGDIEITNDIA